MGKDNKIISIILFCDINLIVNKYLTIFHVSTDCEKYDIQCKRYIEN